MIIDFSPISKLDILKDKLNILKSIYMVFIRYSSFKKLEVDRGNLDKYFLTKFPQLNVNEENDCIGCTLCEQVCPSQSIKIKTSKLIEFPESMSVGQRPLEFMLDPSTCTKCTYCQKVCPVNVLSMTNELKSFETINLLCDLEA